MKLMLSGLCVLTTATIGVPQAAAQDDFSIQPKQLYLEVGGGTLHGKQWKGGIIDDWMDMLPHLTRASGNWMVGVKYFWSDAWGAQVRAEGVVFSSYKFETSYNSQNYLDMPDWKPALSGLSAGLVFRKNVGRVSFQPFVSVGGGIFSGEYNYLNPNKIEFEGFPPPYDVAEERIIVDYKGCKSIVATVSPGVHIGWMLKPRVEFFVELSGLFALSPTPGIIFATNISSSDYVRQAQAVAYPTNRNYLLLKVGMSVGLKKNKKVAGR